MHNTIQFFMYIQHLLGFLFITLPIPNFELECDAAKSW